MSKSSLGGASAAVNVVEDLNAFTPDLFNGQICLVLEGQNHPLAHLMTGACSSNVKFIKTICILNAMCHCSFDASEVGLQDITLEMFQMCLKIELVKLDVAKCKADTNGTESSTDLIAVWESKKSHHRMLHFMDGHTEEVWNLVKKWQM